jgi:hypothetical protein
MRTPRLSALVACLALAGCHDDGGPRPAVQVSYENRLEHLTSHPYDITCGDERHVNRYGKRTYFALADRAQIPGLNRLRSAHSIFFAVTEVCRGKPDSYRPAREAVAGVRSGRWRATLGSGS